MRAGVKGGALLVSNKHPFPADDGKKTVLAGFLAYLVDRFGVENVTYVVIGRKPSNPPPPIGCRTLWIPPPGRMRQGWNAALSLSGLARTSLQEALTWSPTIQRSLDAVSARYEPRLVILDTIRVGQYFDSPGTSPALRALYMDDLFHLRFQRLIDVSAADPSASVDPAGTFAPMLPRLAQAMLRIPAVRDFLYRVEIGKVEGRELAAPARFDLCLLINPNETGVLRARSGRDNVHTSKPLLFREPCTAERRFHGAPRFLMFGSLRHPVYRASVIRFLKQCAGSIFEAMPDARIRLVGDGVDEEIRALCRVLGPNIEACGFVADVVPDFTTSSALLVPLAAAGGLKVKAITALYYGLPIIATEAAVDGIPLQDGVSYIRENDIARFPMHMQRMCDVPFNGEISRNSVRVFEEHYSRERVFGEYDAVFGAALPLGIGPSAC